ncbi:MAG TPA: methyltransferase domain-containing protein [Rudaea sp.]|nr:methyltransferase domain-containing protein [Rudaea sp.]
MHTGLVSERFPRAATYHPDWIRASASGGANPLWLAEWLAETLDLEPGLRVLDLGCGRAASSIFLNREFGVEVWAVDLWFDPAENRERIRDAGVENGVHALRADARALPFEAEFFDAVVSIDAYVYFGTDDLYLNTLARLVKPGGLIGCAGAGLMREFDDVPEHLRQWWTPMHACLHSAEWWRRHWERSGLVDVAVADTLDDGWRYWLDWQRAIAPDNAIEIAALEDDGGSELGYVRVVAGRRADVSPESPVESIPAHYERHPLLAAEAERKA